MVKGICEIICAELGILKDQIEYTILPYEAPHITGSRKVPEIIKSYVVEQAEYIDFLFCGNNGADFASKDEKKYLGTVANIILRETNINLFFMVNPPVP